jgi:hypothetical protein
VRGAKERRAKSEEQGRMEGWGRTKRVKMVKVGESDNGVQGKHTTHHHTHKKASIVVNR